ncbi:MAG: succinate dehydrogenase, cytochrome b556 subunit [Gammaproteobacteria bacterium]
MNSPAPQEVRPGGRPLSPFMLGQYYRFQLTSVLSLLHRMTGVGLSLGAILLVWWFAALAGGPWSYAAFSKHLAAWYGQLLLLGWSWSLLYHLCNGIRHLAWDLGHGYSIPVAYRSGYAVVVVSFLLTAAAWGIAYGL